MTGIAPALAAALMAACFGAFAGAYQHLLYRNPEHRAAPARGRRRVVTIAGVAAGAALTTGFAFRPNHYDAGPAFLTAVFCFALVVLSSTDFERRLLPNRLMYPAIAAAIVFAWGWPDRSVVDVALGALAAIGIAAAMLVVGLAVGAVLRVATTTFGLGDVKLIVLIGLLCGSPAFLSALFIGIFSAGIPSFLLLARGRGRSVFSYGPFLAFGCLVVLLWPTRFT